MRTYPERTQVVETAVDEFDNVTILSRRLISMTTSLPTTSQEQTGKAEDRHVPKHTPTARTAYEPPPRSGRPSLGDGSCSSYTGSTALVVGISA
jgi:hypothetical protein